jgi:hypothetical protein
MIHHFARALAIRENIRGSIREKANPAVTASGTAAARPPVRGHAVMPQVQGIRVHRDPSDNRRTVIAGRFADVCAALDRMVELEAAA